MTRSEGGFDPAQSDPKTLRRAFACFGTGVTVVTTQTPSGPLGMTANSFSSLSLDPALVLWAPALSSLRCPAFLAAQDYCIHVLTSGQLEMARHFARNGDGFERFGWAPGPFGAPTLSGCLVEFHCRTDAIHPAGDHALIVGEIRRVVQHDPSEGGLIFEKGQFGACALFPPPLDQ